MFYKKNKRTVVCSPSTKRFIIGDEYIIVTSPPDEKILDLINSIENVVCIGGGAVIDYAKIISKGPIEICYPTTASGSSETSHAVYWKGKDKMGVKRFIPKEVVILDESIENLPDEIMLWTKCDMIAHCLDVKWSIESTSDSIELANKALELISDNSSNRSLIDAGIIAGRAIEITPTTILHSLSYPLTGKYGIPHGKALSYLIPKLANYLDQKIPDIPYIQDLGEIDWKLVVDEAYLYDKISKINFSINKEELIKIMVNENSNKYNSNQ
jgi:alcohol dehydrogenase class IV